MTYPDVSFRTRCKRIMLLGMLGCIMWWAFSSMLEASRRANYVPVDLTGLQHIGPDFNIAEFYLDETYGFNVGREGGGGSDVCCVMLPRRWRPGLSVYVRWSVGNWSKANQAEMDRNDYKSLTFENFTARVPLEHFDTPDRVQVHFFAGGKARVVVANAPGSHELKQDYFTEDSPVAGTATVGTRVDKLFTQAELDEADRREKERKNRFFGGGDWR